jgi:hypothetical protein
MLLVVSDLSLPIGALEANEKIRFGVAIVGETSLLTAEFGF